MMIFTLAYLTLETSKGHFLIMSILSGGSSPNNSGYLLALLQLFRAIQQLIYMQYGTMMYYVMPSQPVKPTGSINRSKWLDLHVSSLVSWKNMVCSKEPGWKGIGHPAVRQSSAQFWEKTHRLLEAERHEKRKRWRNASNKTFQRCSELLEKVVLRPGA